MNQRLPVKLVDFDPNNFRKSIDVEKRDALKQSIRDHGLLQPPGAIQIGDRYQALWGNQRLWCLKELDIESADFIVLPNKMTETEYKLLKFAENEIRCDLSDYDRAMAVEEIALANPGWNNIELAKRVGYTPSCLTRIRSFTKLAPSGLEAFRLQKIGVKAVYELSKAPAQDQDSLLQISLNGSSAEELGRAVRKNRAPAQEAVRVPRIRCAMPGGAIVCITYPSISLADAIEVAQEWIKQAKRANEQGLDCRTFERVMLDKSKAQ